MIASFFFFFFSFFTQVKCSPTQPPSIRDLNHINTKNQFLSYMIKASNIGVDPKVQIYHVYIYITETFDFQLTSPQFFILAFFIYIFLIRFNSFNFMAPNCKKFIKFLFFKLNLVVWCHTTTILKGNLNYHLREFLDNPNKLYNNSININLSQKMKYISINLIISMFMTFFFKKILSYFLISTNYIFFLFFFSFFLY